MDIFKQYKFILFAILTGVFASVIPGIAFAQEIDDAAKDVITQMETAPSLMTAISYILGLLFGVMGVIKLKDHVEAPQQTPMKVPAINFIVGGSLFSLPIVWEAMQNIIGLPGGVPAIGEWGDSTAFGDLLPTLSGLIGLDGLTTVIDNISNSVWDLPRFAIALSYLLGLLFGILGLLKLKEHVENPQQMPLRTPIIRLLVGGALVSIPGIMMAVSNLIGGSNLDNQSTLQTLFGDLISDISGLLGSSNISAIASNLQQNFAALPALASIVAYLLAVVLTVSGLLKMKEHVEQPEQITLKEPVIRLGVAGALFSAPAIAGAMQRTISGDGISAADQIVSGLGMVQNIATAGCSVGSMISGIFGSLGSVFAAGWNILISTVTSKSGKTSTSIDSSGADATLGDAICSAYMATQAVPTMLISLSFAFGAGLVVWGLVKMKEHVLNPQQSSVWDFSSKLIAAGAFFSLPYVIRVVGNTVMGVDFPLLFGSFALNDTSTAAGGMTLDMMLTQFMMSVYGPTLTIINWFGTIVGMIFVMIGISRLLRSAQEGPRGPGGLGTLMTFVAAGFLFSIQPFMGTVVGSFFGSGAVSNTASLAYLDAAAPETAHIQNVVSGMYMFMIMLGMISFIRGIFIVRAVAEGNGQASMMAGITHMVGGALAVNIGGVINLVQSTLGLDGYGVSFTFGGGGQGLFDLIF